MKAEGNKEESWKEVFKYSAWDRGNWLRSCYFRELRCHEARIGKIRRWADAERNKTATTGKERKGGEVDFELIRSAYNVIYIYWPRKYSNIFYQFNQRLLQRWCITNNTNSSKKNICKIKAYQAFISIQSLREKTKERKYLHWFTWFI